MCDYGDMVRRDGVEPTIESLGCQPMLLTHHQHTYEIDTCLIHKSYYGLRDYVYARVHFDGLRNDSNEAISIKIEYVELWIQGAGPYEVADQTASTANHDGGGAVEGELCFNPVSKTYTTICNGPVSGFASISNHLQAGCPYPDCPYTDQSLTEGKIHTVPRNYTAYASYKIRWADGTYSAWLLGVDHATF